jgi:PST family polysaccharide transporter
MTSIKSIWHSLGWSATSQFGRQSFQLVVTIVLARLLSPTDFGLVAMATVITGFISIFGDLGTSAAVIQKQDSSTKFLSSVFWLNVGFGLLVMFFIIIIAPLVAAFYQEQRLVSILYVLSAIFPVMGLASLQRALLEKSMSFNTLAGIELASTAIGGIAAIAAALSNAGTWSLVVQAMGTTVSTAVLVWLCSAWRPRFEMSIGEIKKIGVFSANLTGFNIFNYWARNADKLLIGKFLGSQDLGYYTLAYGILMFPIMNLSAVIGRVLFPYLSNMQADEAQFRKTYLKTIRGIALITFPVMALLFVLAEPFVDIVFGANWLPVVPLLLIFAPIGAVQSVGHPVGVIYMVKGQTGLLLRWGIFSGLIAISSFIIGLRWGVIGVAVSYAVAVALLTYPVNAIPFRLIGLKVKDGLRVLWRPALSALIMAVVVFTVSARLFPPFSDWKLLALNALIGLAVYCTVSLKINA